jgi:CubicO group peptidase (beta-lactamase class C family)
MPHLPKARPQEIGIDANRLEIAHKLLDSWTSGDSPPLPAAAMIVGRGGKIVEPRYFGKQGPEADAPPLRRDGLFLMASITKPMTYLAGLMLVERGLVNLGDLVTKHFPDFAAHHKEETRVMHLFTHTSGLPDMLPNNRGLRRQQAPLEKFVEGAIRDTMPLFPPGTSFSYQSMGTLMVAALVQNLSGLTIHEFLRKEVFEPLGMKSTALGSRTLDRERIARLKPSDEQEVDWGWNSRYWQELGVPWGGMFSTPEDMAIVCDLMLRGGEHAGIRLLAPATARLMSTNRLDDLPDVPEPLRRTKAWGLGWQMNHPSADDSLCDLLTRDAYGHLGATGTLLWIDPHLEGFFVLCTTAPRDLHPWRLVALSNAAAAAFV